MKEFETSTRVTLFDTDASGIAHFLKIQRFFEVGEQEVLRPLNIKLGDPTHGGIHFPRVHVDVTYHQPLYVDDMITIVTRCSHIGRTSLTWQHRIMREGSCCVEGLVTAVLIDASTSAPGPIPEGWRVYLGVS